MAQKHLVEADPSLPAMSTLSCFNDYAEWLQTKFEYAMYLDPHDYVKVENVGYRHKEVIGPLLVNYSDSKDSDDSDANNWITHNDDNDNSDHEVCGISGQGGQKFVPSQELSDQNDSNSSIEEAINAQPNFAANQIAAPLNPSNANDLSHEIRLRPHERLDFTDMGGRSVVEFISYLKGKIQFCEEERAFGKTHKTGELRMVWSSGFTTSKCVPFRCIIKKCPTPNRLFSNISIYNTHCLNSHKPQHDAQTEGLRLKVQFDSITGKMGKDAVQCGSCPQFFEPRSIKHLQNSGCNKKVPVFDTVARDLYTQHTLKQLQTDKRYVKPQTFFETMFGEDGYVNLLHCIVEGHYDPRIKSSLVININVCEPVGSGVRFYIIGCAELHLAYMGSCICQLIERMRNHIAKVSHGGQILNFESKYEVLISSIGYCASNEDLLTAKSSFEFLIVNNFDGINNVEFTNVIRI